MDDAIIFTVGLIMGICVGVAVTANAVGDRLRQFESFKNIAITNGYATYSSNISGGPVFTWVDPAISIDKVSTQDE